MNLDDLTVEVRDKRLNRLGVVGGADLNLTAAPVFNNVGTWSLMLAPEHEMARALRTPGSGICVYGQSDVLFSGPTDNITYQATADAPYGMLKFDGVTDETILAGIVCWPDAPLFRDITMTNDYDTQTGPAETLLHGYVTSQITNPAATDRFTDGTIFRDMNYTTGKLTQIVHGSNLGRGPVTTRKARFYNLGAYLATIARPGNLGFRMVQRDDTISFETYQIRDRTSEVRFDLWNNTISDATISVAAPGMTKAIIAGQGQMHNRKIYENFEPDLEILWGRHIEVFIDQRQATTDAELAQAYEDAKAENGFTQIAAKFTPTEDDTLRFGVHWNLGDIVTAVGDDDEYSAPVTSYVLKADQDGVRIGAILGDPTLVGVGSSAAAQLAAVTQNVSALQSAQ